MNAISHAGKCPIPYTVTGGGCKVVLQGNQVVSGKGPRTEFVKMLSSLLNLSNPGATEKGIPPELIRVLTDANDQIISIRDIAKIAPWKTEADKVKNAKEYLANNPGEFPYINPEHIEEPWFDLPESMRIARYNTLPYAALKKKIVIKGSHAVKILEAIANKSPIPKVPFRRIQ